jgi:hypothetical protein
MTDYEAQQLANAIAGGLVIWAFIAIVFVVLYIVALYKMLSKAGYSGWLALLTLIPFFGGIIGFILILWLAFADWPVLQELRSLKGRGMSMGGPPTYGPSGAQPAYMPPAQPPAYAPPTSPPANPPMYQSPVTPEPAAPPPSPAYQPPPAPAAPAPEAPAAPGAEPPAAPPAPPGAEPPAGS